MTQLLVGTVRGKTIVFDEALPVPEGESVEVIVRTPSGNSKPGDGLLRSEGALADDFTDEDERILDEIQRARHVSTRRDIEP